MTAPFKDHFSSRAAAYAAFRPGYPAALVDRLAELAPARRLALDVGCGSGQLSTQLAARSERVAATDASAAQLANAAPHPKVAYRRAPAEAAGLDQASADLVTAAQAAHWFDLAAFYAEARRVLGPRGVIALISYGVIEADGALGETLARFGSELAAAWGEPATAREVRWPLALRLGRV
jgi:SAM-dependent methyltransferase